MRSLKRIGSVVALTVVLAGTTGCTKEENFLWNLWHNEAPAEAEAFASTITQQQAFDGQPTLTPDQFASVTAQVQALEARTPCERADDMINSAGLPDHFHGVMRRESGCDPRAHNPSGASGALQIMPMWADDCGTIRGDRGAGTGLFDLWTNIRCGVHVYSVQGGNAWTTW